MTAAKIRRPHGLWSSPITAEMLSEAVPIPEAEWSPDGKWLVWLEEHSGQGILFYSDGGVGDSRRLTGSESVRATIGYGGGHFTVGRTHAYFVEKSGRLCAIGLDSGAGRPLTPAGTLAASPALSPDGMWLAYVFELEGAAGLALADAEGRRWPSKLAEGADFYMQPSWSPSGRALAWVEWDHPNMPWDGTRLMVGAIAPRDDGSWTLARREIFAGGNGEAILQPQFSPDGTHLAYVSDREGWFRLYVRNLALGEERCVTPEPGEYGGAAWQQGMRWYGWSPDGASLIATRNRAGAIDLVRVDAEGRGSQALAAPGYTTLTRPVVHPLDGRVAALAAGERCPPRLVVVDPLAEAGAAAPRVMRRTGSEQVPDGDLAEILPLSWRNESGETIHGLFAAPTSSRFASEGLPPLIVQVHGGPTSQAYRTWRPDAQFFASRGYAFLDINHRGSTGYGRAYRERLRGQWGVYDVEDAISGLRHVAEQGWADAGRAAIRGSSAGGYTVLRALTMHPGLFRAGLCFYGISELFALARDTHKFEAHYLDSLLGALPGAAAVYRERSPLQMADRITSPLIVFQGAEDRVVPPAQSELIVASLRTRGVPVEYHLFPGEGHGFRERANLRAALEAMERFLQTHVVFA